MQTIEVPTHATRSEHRKTRLSPSSHAGEVFKWDLWEFARVGKAGGFFWVVQCYNFAFCFCISVRFVSCSVFRGARITVSLFMDLHLYFTQKLSESISQPASPMTAADVFRRVAMLQTDWSSNWAPGGRKCGWSAFMTENGTLNKASLLTMKCFCCSLRSAGLVWDKTHPRRSYKLQRNTAKQKNTQVMAARLTAEPWRLHPSVLSSRIDPLF